MLKRGKKKKEAEKKPTADTEQQEKVSEADNAETAANPGELISSLSETLEKIINSLIGCLMVCFLF